MLGLWVIAPSTAKTEDSNKVSVKAKRISFKIIQGKILCLNFKDRVKSDIVWKNSACQGGRYIGCVFFYIIFTRKKNLLLVFENIY